jgi:hypothetical protein
MEMASTMSGTFKPLALADIRWLSLTAGAGKSSIMAATRIAAGTAQQMGKRSPKASIVISLMGTA